MKKIALFACTLLFSFLSYANYKVDKSSNLHKVTGKNQISLREIDELIQKLGKDKSYESLKIVELQNNYVELLTKSKSNLSEITKSGDSILESDEWDELIAPYDLSSFDEKAEQELKLNILKKVKELGYSNVTIKINKSTKEDKVSLDYEINAGDVCRIHKVSFETDNLFLKTDLEGKFLNYVGKPLTDNFLKFANDETQKYFLQNRFLDARILDTKVQYNSDRTEANIFFSLSKSFHYEVLFYGNSFLNESQLLKNIKLSEDHLLIEKNLNRVKLNIINAYKSFGFAEAQVSIEKKNIENNFKKILIVKINEGTRYKLRDIVINGKISKEPSYYEKKILRLLDNEQGFRYLSEEKMKKAVADMNDELMEEGYLGSKVIGTRSEFKGDHADYEVTLDEGVPTQIRLIKFNGLSQFSSNELMQVIELQTNQTLDLNLIRSSYQKITNFYNSKGFLEFKIKNQEKGILSYNNNNTFVDVVYELYEGPEIKVKDISIFGNQKTKDSVVLREINFQPGDVLTKQSLQDSIYNLERSGLFTEIAITPSPVNTNISNRTVKIELKEKNPGLFSSGLGVSLQGLQNPPVTYRGFLGLQYNNLFQRAYRASLRLEGQYQDRKDLRYPEWKAIFGFYEPFLFGSKTRFNTLITHIEEIFDQKNEVIQVREANEISFLLEKNFTRHYKFIWNFWTFSNQKFFNPRPDNNSPRNEQTTNIGSIGPIFEIDFRNNAFLPTKGNYARFEFEYANPTLLSTKTDTREINFARLTSAFTNYMPLNDSQRLVWANSLRGGHVVNLGAKGDSPTFGIPAIKAFFLGGQSTIRGYDIRASTPERIPSLAEICPSCNSISDFYVSDSSSYFLVKSELRFPLFSDIGGVVFYDGGAVFINSKNVSIADPYRDSAGFGFRYNTPFGALALDVGFKLDKKENEGTHSFHLAIGSF